MIAEQDGLRMHYVDEGEGDPVLLLHGEPTWSHLYRKVIPELTPTARVIAPDYFGFGLSDKPTDRDWYSYDAHTASIEQLIEQLDLRNVTIVMQDWGGPIGFRVAVEHPERVARLVVLNTGIYSGRPPGETWLRFRELVRETGTDFQPSRLIRLTLTKELSDEELDAYDAPYPTPESKTGVLMFPELVPDSDDHPSAAAMLAVRDKLAHWEKPALVFFGDSDPIFSPRVAERLAQHIPGAELQPPIEGAGHFVQEDAGAEVGQRIARWLKTPPSV
jgi:haloalkane dehalogenase